MTQKVYTEPLLTLPEKISLSAFALSNIGKLFELIETKDRVYLEVLYNYCDVLSNFTHHEMETDTDEIARRIADTFCSTKVYLGPTFAPAQSKAKLLQISKFLTDTYNRKPDNVPTLSEKDAEYEFSQTVFDLVMDTFQSRLKTDTILGPLWERFKSRKEKEPLATLSDTKLQERKKEKERLQIKAQEDEIKYRALTEKYDREQKEREKKLQSETKLKQQQYRESLMLEKAMDLDSSDESSSSDDDEKDITPSIREVDKTTDVIIRKNVNLSEYDLRRAGVYTFLDKPFYKTNDLVRVSLFQEDGGSRQRTKDDPNRLLFEFIAEDGLHYACLQGIRVDGDFWTMSSYIWYTPISNIKGLWEFPNNLTMPRITTRFFVNQINQEIGIIGQDSDKFQKFMEDVSSMSIVPMIKYFKVMYKRTFAELPDLLKIGDGTKEWWYRALFDGSIDIRPIEKPTQLPFCDICTPASKSKATHILVLIDKDGTIQKNLCLLEGKPPVSATMVTKAETKTIVKSGTTMYEEEKCIVYIERIIDNMLTFTLAQLCLKLRINPYAPEYFRARFVKNVKFGAQKRFHCDVRIPIQYGRVLERYDCPD